MEQQLHEFFHKTQTPYSYIDDKGIYSFTPTQEKVRRTDTNDSAENKNVEKKENGQKSN